MSEKICIRIFGDSFAVGRNDSILRALQAYAYARGLPTYGFKSFCWNASCQQCVLEFTDGGVRECDYACQTDAVDGMSVETIPEVLMWSEPADHD